jgi:hypothetical protein
MKASSGKNVRMWVGFSCLRIGSSGALMWTQYEFSCSINDKEFIDYLSTFQLLEKETVQWS